jgi:hypothetical protein
MKKLQHRRLKTKPNLSDLAQMIRYRGKYRMTGNFEPWICSVVEATLVEVWQMVEQSITNGNILNESY